MGWVYVPGLEVSNSASELRPEETSVWCATSSGKPTRRPLSWAGWKRRPWIERLSGTILRPSMADRGVVSWIALLQVSRVSPTVSRGRKRGTRMTGRSGRNSSESSRNPNQLSFSLKMSRLSSSTLNRSIAAYQDWVSISHRHYFKPIRLSELPTSENVSISLLPTPTARDHKDGACASANVPMNSLLGRYVVMVLPTPTAADYKASGAAGYSTSSGRHSGTTLTDAVLGAASADRIGKLNPRLSEWMMGFPPGWTSSAPLEMPSFRTWLQRRGLT